MASTVSNGNDYLRKGNRRRGGTKSCSHSARNNLTDIKELLVDIQITLAAILRENQELKQEILELKSALKVIQRETEKLKTQLTKAEKANDTLRDELNHIRMKLKDQIEEMNKLDEKHDDLEQYSVTRKNSLEILGVTEGAYTSTDEVVIRIGEAINVDSNRRTQTQKKNH